MNLKKILSLPVVSTDLPGNTKEEILENLVDILAEAGKIEDRKAALRCVLEREEKMSTGIQEGVAIPHGKTDTLDELVACVALKKEGVDFKALDGKPSTIFILTLSPLNRTGPHVQFLAEISRLLNDRTKRERLLQAESREEMLDLLTSR
ncbi:MAG: PTS sugar transporter subunit IIA [Spirochaetales bacterium]|nr:PTS sugar transporter subunit IIA [Spirochaetales bacterium]